MATSLGDDIGPYLGVKAEDGTPVHLDPHLASRRNEPTLIGIFGVLGHGKSVCAMKTVWWDRLRGASAAMVAPEGCPAGFLELCRRAGRVNKIWLDDDGQDGNVSLDPYRIMVDPFEGAAGGHGAADATALGTAGRRQDGDPGRGEPRGGPK